MREKILIVEDEEKMQTLLSIMLENEGYKIIKAYDGSEGLEKFNKERPHLIILDMILDEMMGDSFLIYLKDRHPDTCVPVILSTILSRSTCERLTEIHPNIYHLQKPYDKEALLKVIREKLGKGN